MFNKMKPVLLIITGLTLILAACAAPEPEPTTAPAIEPTNTTAPLPVETTLPATDAPAPADPTATTAAPVTASVSFANDVLPILNSRCFNCHGGDATREGLSMASYDTLMAGSDNGPVIVPGDPDNSLLVKQLLNGKMPKRGPKLTPEQIQIIIDWILAGAPNN